MFNLFGMVFPGICRLLARQLDLKKLDWFFLNTLQMYDINSAKPPPVARFSVF
jgi:hypothetical protein